MNRRRFLLALGLAPIGVPAVSRGNIVPCFATDIARAAETSADVDLIIDQIDRESFKRMRR